MAVREAEVLARPRQPIQLVGRLVVAQPVAAIVREPQLARVRMEVEAHAVPDPARDDLRRPTREVDPRDRRESGPLGAQMLQGAPTGT